MRNLKNGSNQSLYIYETILYDRYKSNLGLMYSIVSCAVNDTQTYVSMYIMFGQPNFCPHDTFQNTVNGPVSLFNLGGPKGYLKEGDYLQKQRRT